MDAEIDEHANEDEERYRDPEFGLVDEPWSLLTCRTGIVLHEESNAVLL
jgi:hypothetical protein